MKVLHVYSGNLYGGVEALLSTLARERGQCPEMEPRFALCFEGRLSAQLAAAGIPAHRLGAVRASRPWTVWRARREMTRLLRSERFDLVLCHSPWAHAVFAPCVRAARRPLALWLHNPPSSQSWVERWARLTRPDLVLCNSRYTAAASASLYPGVPLEVLYYPVPPPAPAAPARRAALRQELKTPEEATVIAQVSRMEPWKGQAVLLRALGLLREVPGWTCWIAGGAQRPAERRYLESLEALAARLGIADRVRFLGERADVPELMAAADVFCQPNAEPEPFGISFVEALHAGLPVVASAAGGALEIVDGSCGVLAPPGDPPALARALKGLLEDQALRRRLGGAGPARALALCSPRAQLKLLCDAARRLSGDGQSPLVTIVIPTKDRPDCLRRLLSSIARQDYLSLETLVIDDGSEPPVQASGPGIRVLRSDKNGGISRARNRGIAEARGELVLSLDDDVELIAEDTVSRAVDLARREPRAGAIGFMQLMPDGRPKPSGEPQKGDRACYTAFFYGYAFLARKRAFQAAGGFDEFLDWGFEEVELSLRLHDAGYGVLYAPALQVTHHEEPRGRDWKKIYRLIRRNVLLTVLLHYPLWLIAPAIAKNLLVYLRQTRAKFGADWAGLPWLWRELWSARAYVKARRAPLSLSTLFAFHKLRRFPAPLEGAR